MRFIDKYDRKVQDLAEDHVQSVWENLSREEGAVQDVVFSAMRTLLIYADGAGRSWGRMEKREVLQHFLTADVAMLRKMAEASPKEMQEDYFAKYYKGRFREQKRKYHAAQFIERLGLKVCPYCDRNYINNVYRDMDGKVRQTGQIDHFFPKAEYPMLAMCFYNLIPVCAGCNLMKHEWELSMNPYESGIEKQVYFDAFWDGNTPETEENLHLRMYYTPKMKRNVEILALDREYEQHKDVAFEIVRTATFYNETKQEELCRNYPELFPDRSMLRRILYHMDLEKKNTRPLQKLYGDIIKTYDP